MRKTLRPFPEILRRPPQPDDDLSLELQQHLLDALAGHVTRNARVSLLDVPWHRNAGDFAIWLGTIAILQRLGARVVEETTLFDYDPERTRRLLGADGLILMNGGGNFGTLWPIIHDFRERVLQDHPERQIIQMPQSIYFDDDEALRRTADLCSHHKHFILYVRDEESLSVAHHSLGIDAFLLPDAAFALGLLMPSTAPVADLVYVRRNDHERNAHEGDMDGSLLVTDLVLPDDFLPHAARRRPRQMMWSRSSRGGRRDAGAILLEGLRRLSQGRFVITERLHGHILCTLLGQPHAVLDTAFGKSSSFMRSFTASAPYGRLCGSLEEAVALGRDTLRADHARSRNMLG